MGAWGPKLYQDDIAEEVRNYYKDQLRRGKTGKEITQELIAQNAFLTSDFDDAPIFWFALADTQWNLGRLENFVKEQALHHIYAGYDVKRWETENPKHAKTRAKLLADLEHKLLSAQPNEKKISQYKLYHCEWKIGDVYAYQLNSEYAEEKGLYGRYFLFQKIGETTYYPGHTVPTVWIKITKDKKIPKTADEFDELDYVQTSFTEYENRFLPIDFKRPEKDIAEKSQIKYEVDDCGFLPQYRAILRNTSKSVIPKSLFFVGNFQNIKSPKKEFVPHNELNIPSFEWKFFDKSMIDKYCGFNLRQYQVYLNHL